MIECKEIYQLKMLEVNRKLKIKIWLILFRFNKPTVPNKLMGKFNQTRCRQSTSISLRDIKIIDQPVKLLNKIIAL